jgi:hypothetical protein
MAVLWESSAEGVSMAESAAGLRHCAAENLDRDSIGRTSRPAVAGLVRPICPFA